MSAPVLLEGEQIPRSLRESCRPCRRLYLEGRMPDADRPRVAVVGSRTPSVSGARVALELGRELARAGVVVVSGLARGIDAAAHRGALDGGGITVAFLGCGLDVVYPRTSRLLAHEIPGSGGALLSEYPPGTPPLPFRFVERNRLVAAYTRGTVVVEGGAQSGALITAGLALELGRELWVVPGDPRRPSCRGTNRLLRDGASAVLDAGDVLAALGLLGTGSDADLPAPPPGLSSNEHEVWVSLAGSGPCDLQTLSRETSLPVASLLEALSMLELAGHVEKDREGYAVVRRGPIR